MTILSDSGADYDDSITSDSVIDPDDAPVGLSDPQVASQKREMLDAVNRLRAGGAHLDLDIPVIVVLGSQSAGKSSLIEAISGITLPRSSGTCTRCPTECQLSRSSEPWRCIISLRIVTDESGAVLAQPRRVEFGEPIFAKPLVTERIRRAQCAILNPSTPAIHFLEPSPVAVEERQLSFSSNSVCLEISGKDVDDLSFVDLPGLIPGGDPHDSALVQQLAEVYICKESCIILLTIACETDFENQSSHRLAARFDPHGSRTIGVLTKPDRIPPGEEDSWIRMIQGDGDRKEGGIEFFSVKNPDSQDIKNGITYEQAREKEAQFFSTKAPWSGLEWLYQRRLGTEKLTRRLAQVLSNLISKRLPELEAEVDKLLEQASHGLSRLPNPPSSEPVGEMLRLIGAFVRSVENLIDGAPDEDGLLQALRGPRVDFRKAIRQTAPDFRPLERPSKSESPTIPSPPSFLSDEEEDWEYRPSDSTVAIYVEDVMARANSAVTRELPNNFPFIVKKHYIGAVVKRWDSPSKQLFDCTKKELNKRIKAVIEDHFSNFTYGHLKQRVIHIVQGHIQKCADAAEQHINSLLEEEQEPFTMNEHYFMEYRSKFLGHYKGIRQKARSSFIDNLESSDLFMKCAVSKVIAGLAELDLRSIDPSFLPRLLPPDPTEPAIEIMAEVRAYFQVAYKRFADNVPMGVDRTLLRGIKIGLEAALFNGLAVGGAGGYERCRSLLSEPEDIIERRSELQKRRERLMKAKEELLQAFG
ncbi:P-loop containing nucleoside triphosphate hydrolase protein [Lactifluus subvellereus]|nr:P-loop containing nucleoside triphosphate hydrolase protein [Lactifluus subvellereus]